MNVNIENPKVIRALPAKYNKFAGFAYWLLGQMKDIQVLSANGYDNTCDMMHLLSGDIPSQIEFYEKFLAEATVSKRLMKAEIKHYKSKSKKEKVVKDKNMTVNNSVTDEPITEKKKRGRKVKQPAEEPIIPSEESL
uniref:Uncharacterized protein n=1 Tax=viral metagenome TaxID=1070528 RepID=A0A6C0I1I1_9ZZZZ